MNRRSPDRRFLLTQSRMKNFLVIGGSSGIGKALVQLLSETSENEIYASYNSTSVDFTNSNIHTFNWNYKDTLNTDELPDTLDGVAYCPGSINLLPFHRIKYADFVSDYELQVGGAIKVLQSVHQKLKSGSQSSVVLFSTVAAQTGFTFHSQVSSSKGAIEGLTRALSAEWAPEVRINAIAPSITDTPLAGRLLNSEDKKKANAERHPLKKIGSPLDIAEMASFLLSEKSSWITGQILKVDGGMSVIK